MEGTFRFADEMPATTKWQSRDNAVTHQAATQEYFPSGRQSGSYRVVAQSAMRDLIQGTSRCDLRHGCVVASAI
jgi:hypothetical protein